MRSRTVNLRIGRLTIDTAAGRPPERHVLLTALAQALRDIPLSGNAADLQAEVSASIRDTVAETIAAPRTPPGGRA